MRSFHAAVFVFAAVCAAALGFMSRPVGAKDADATITAVSVSGQPNAYTFDVTIRSNDTGMDRYADWWEVVDANGKLVYRRVLLHDHADEQPFTRDGGPVKIAADATVTVRAHFYPTGYSVDAMHGSAKSGFTRVTLDPGFAAGLEREQPLPRR